MKARAILVLLVILNAVTLPVRAESNWKGVDETVVEKVAADAGHPATQPFINTDRGDLLLFVFLVAGVVGGFVAGYAFRSLFPPKGSRKPCS